MDTNLRQYVPRLTPFPYSPILLLDKEEVDLLIVCGACRGVNEEGEGEQVNFRICLILVAMSRVRW